MIVRTIPGYFKQCAELKKLERQMGEGCGGLLLSAMLESFEQTPIKTNLSTQDINIRTLFDWTRDIWYEDPFLERIGRIFVVYRSVPGSSDYPQYIGDIVLQWIAKILSSYKTYKFAVNDDRSRVRVLEHKIIAILVLWQECVGDLHELLMHTKALAEIGWQYYARLDNQDSCYPPDILRIYIDYLERAFAPGILAQYAYEPTFIQALLNSHQIEWREIPVSDYTPMHYKAIEIISERCPSAIQTVAKSQLFGSTILTDQHVSQHFFQIIDSPAGVHKGQQIYKRTIIALGMVNHEEQIKLRI